MPINAGPEYIAAEKRYLQAQSVEEKISGTEEMIKTAPKHKGTENLLRELKTRLKKLKQQSEKAKKSAGGKKGIRKEGFQCLLIGLPNSGKSSILTKITNAKPKISPHPFTTFEPELGTMDYDGVKAQIIDMPSIGSENFETSLVHTADCIILVLENIAQLKEVQDSIKNSKAPKIVAISKSDKLNDTELRKLEATIKSKKLNGLMVSCTTNHNLEQLKERIFNEMHIIRVFTKEPGKQKTNLPITLKENSTVKDAAEKIRKGFSQQIKETRLTGPSSKFPNQIVGLTHKLKDLDVIEFHTK